MSSRCDFQFCLNWHQNLWDGGLFPPPLFTHWHNFHPAKLFKNKEGKGLPVQATCESHPNMKDLCKSLAGKPSMCHLVTSLFYALIPRTENESENQKQFPFIFKYKIVKGKFPICV